jgi:hypothetical protein
MFNTYAFADKAGPILFEKAEPPLGSNTLTSSPVHKLAPLPYPGAAGGGAGPNGEPAIIFCPRAHRM